MAEPSPPKKRRPGCLRLMISAAILLVLGIIWALFMAGDFRAFEVIGDSMLNTLNRGDRLIAEKNSPGTLKVGDIVVVDLPGDDDNEIIKRLVAVPGDTVSLRDSVFSVNGQPESQPPGAVPFPPNALIPPTQLGSDEYYVLGDNRPISYDSEDFGPIPAKAIWGVALFRYRPWEKRGTLK